MTLITLQSSRVRSCSKSGEAYVFNVHSTTVMTVMVLGGIFTNFSTLLLHFLQHPFRHFRINITKALNV